MQTTLIIFLVSLLSLGIFIKWASSGADFGNATEQKVINTNLEHSVDDTVTIMSWNIAWAYGMGSEGVAYEPKDKKHFISALNKISDVIKSRDCDIVLLQEVDFNSAKSHGIDQLKYLADKLNMNVAYAPSWRLNYLPFPYWPIKNHFGRVDSGGAILSKFPIKSNEVILHEKPKSNPWHYNLFYLSRYTQFVKVQIKDKLWLVSNNHLEAFAKENRKNQVKSLVQKLSNTQDILVVGGDFNTTPSSASKKGKFSGYPDDDYEDDQSYELMSEVQGIKDTLDKQTYSENEKAWFTFSSVRPDRKLDYLFVGEDFEVEEFDVIQTPVSDHFPIWTRIKLN
ncbi:MAG: endonuclease/exonuclease/phosphatase family protein [Bacteriovoracaceae bacterium]|nr:endonuclease/exonuclease/phosphatase family protein [Bacteriovoracaceae bacterium]